MDGQNHIVLHRKKWIKVDDCLCHRDIIGMKFLCCDWIPTSKLQSIRSIHHIMAYLEQPIQNEADSNKHLECIICELLYTINRYDLLKLFGKSSKEMEYELTKNHFILDYRKFMYKISMNLKDEEVEQLKFIYCDNYPKLDSDSYGNKVPGSTKSSPFDMFMFMEQKDLLGQQAHHLDLLIDMLDTIHRQDLVKDVQTFKNLFPEHHSVQDNQSLLHLSEYDVSLSTATNQPAPMLNGIQPSSCSSSSPCFSLQQLESSRYPSAQSRQVMDASAANCFEISSEHKHSNSACQKQGQESCNLDDNRAPVVVSGFIPRGPPSSACRSLPAYSSRPPHCTPPEYRMDRKPRGYCLIINIEKFEEETKLKNRLGSSADKDALINLFRNELLFNVVVKENLKPGGIKKFIGDFAKKDHTKFDCFVCIVLSHGYEGGVYASNGEPVPLHEFTSPLTSKNCPTLKDKPKLFFIQACQGKGTIVDDAKCPARQSLDPDAASSLPPASLAAEEPRAPAAVAEPHFLLALATLPGHVSYRSRSAGTWYIVALVETLTQHHYTWSLGQILNHVNWRVTEAVAPQDGKAFKQCPAPLTSLTKELYFR